MVKNIWILFTCRWSGHKTFPFSLCPKWATWWNFHYLTYSILCSCNWNLEKRDFEWQPLYIDLWRFERYFELKIMKLCETLNSNLSQSSPKNSAEFEMILAVKTIQIITVWTLTIWKLDFEWWPSEIQCANQFCTKSTWLSCWKIIMMFWQLLSICNSTTSVAFIFWLQVNGLIIQNMPL